MSGDAEEYIRQVLAAWDALGQTLGHNAKETGIILWRGGTRLQRLASDVGIQAPAYIKIDSRAALGICNRTGIGEVRHLATGQLLV